VSILRPRSPSVHARASRRLVPAVVALESRLNLDGLSPTAGLPPPPPPGMPPPDAANLPPMSEPIPPPPPWYQPVLDLAGTVGAAAGRGWNALR